MYHSKRDCGEVKSRRVHSCSLGQLEEKLLDKLRKITILAGAIDADIEDCVCLLVYAIAEERCAELLSIADSMVNDAREAFAKANEPEKPITRKVVDNLSDLPEEVREHLAAELAHLRLNREERKGH